MTETPILHGYWRSSASFRVRMALNLKGISYTQANHDLRRGAQKEADYLAVSPQGLVPALVVGSQSVIQSPAILEWIDEIWPDPPLLPEDKAGRALVRSMVSLIACDIHPLNNLRVLNALRSDWHASEDQVRAWVQNWIGQGFAAFETLVGMHGGQYCYGDRISLADCMLAPQIYSAERFSLTLAPFPRIRAIGKTLFELEAVAKAHPDCQPDADRPG